jgi:uncharacterized protein (DUF736 family)
MIIGTFTQNDHEGFHGQINAAGLNLTGVVFEAMKKGANFAISAANGSECFEVGAAWKKEGEYGPYLSVKLDSPVFAEPINATLALKPNDAGQYALRWNRPKTRTEG